MRTRTALVGVAASLLAATVPAANAHAAGPLPSPPPADNLVVDLVTVNGSGCTAGTVTAEVAPDNTAFSVTYTQYRATVGVGAAPTDFRKNCQLTLALHLPAGFTVAIHEVDHQGYASLAQGATGMQRASHYAVGSPQTLITHTFAGPMDGTWQATDSVWFEPTYLPCDAAPRLNINTELRVFAGNSDATTTTSVMSMDSIDGSSASRYHLAWATC